MNGPLSPDSRNWAMAAHLSAFLGAWLALAFVGPLVVWLLKRDTDRFVTSHAIASLNFNLTMFVLLVIGVVLVIFTLGIGALVVLPVAGIVALVWIVLTVVAAVKASNGETFSYPGAFPFVRESGPSAPPVPPA